MTSVIPIIILKYANSSLESHKHTLVQLVGEGHVAVVESIFLFDNFLAFLTINSHLNHNNYNKPKFVKKSISGKQVW